MLARKFGYDRIDLFVIFLRRQSENIISLRIHRKLHVGLARKGRLKHVHRSGRIRTEEPMSFEKRWLCNRCLGRLVTRLDIYFSGDVP